MFESSYNELKKEPVRKNFVEGQYGSSDATVMDCVWNCLKKEPCLGMTADQFDNLAAVLCRRSAAHWQRTMMRANDSLKQGEIFIM